MFYSRGSESVRFDVNSRLLSRELIGEMIKEKGL